MSKNKQGGTAMKNIGDIIRAHRNRKDLTQEELGKMLFVSKQAVSKWETGRTLPDLDMTQKLIEVLEIDPKEILGCTVQETKNTRKKLKIFVISTAAVLAVICVIFAVLFIDNKIKNDRYEEWLRNYNPYSNDDVNAHNLDAIRVNMIQLLASPEKYDGKIVSVIGVGELDFESYYLYLSKDDYRFRTGNRIGIRLGERATPYEEAQKYNGKYVIVEGMFEKIDGDPRYYNVTVKIKDISRYELWESLWLDTAYETE